MSMNRMIDSSSLFLRLTFSLWLCLKLAVVHGQPTEDAGGFLSIDCGRPDCDHFKSYDRGITYMCDGRFIETGESHRLPDNAGSESSPKKYLRSFPNGTRNCFRIGVKQNQKYIVRTYFMYGNYDGRRRLPTFHYYIGIHFMRKYEGGEFSTVTYNVYEALVMSAAGSPNPHLSVCLVNINEGTPFISAIDLRPIPNRLYPQVNSTFPLFMANRIGYGGRTHYWYPYDKFDRVWFDDNWTSKGWNTIEAATSTLVAETTELYYYQLPQIVMQTAIVPRNDTSLEFHNDPWVNEVDVPLPNCCIYLYFAELEQLNPNESRIFTVSVDNVVLSDAIQLKYLQMKAFSSVFHPPRSGRYFLQISAVNGSTKPPLLNAMENYCYHDELRQPETETGEVNAVEAIKKLYKLQRNWMGDPCVPKAFKWEGLTCIYEEFISPSIVSLNLSSTLLSGAISSCFANLTRLQRLDLSDNNLTGNIPESLGSLSKLKYLNLARNNLQGPIPTSLLERSANHSLRLSLEGNPRLCTTQDSCLVENKKDVNNNESRNSATIVIAVTSIIVTMVLVVGLLTVGWKLLKRRKSRVNTRLQVSETRDGGGGGGVVLDIKSFTYKELVTITSNFSNQIGRGGFALVYAGIYKDDIQVAVKMLKSSSSIEGYTEFDAELKILKKVHHKNLVPFVGYCQSKNHLALVYKFMGGGSVADHLAGKFDVTGSSNFRWRDRLRIAAEAAQGLEYLHKGCAPAIVHRDVKASNILLTENMEARIADFGLSKFKMDGASFVVTRVFGTPGYLDPEYFKTNRLHEKSDVYSFGVVLMEMITGRSAVFDGSTHLVGWVREKRKLGQITGTIDGRLRDYNVNSIRNAMETAVACCVPQSLGRPDISEVYGRLKECLELEETDRAMTM